MASAPIAPPPRYRRRRSMAGPVVLILIGVMFLLGTMHVVSMASVGLIFAHYWPLLLILWGVVKLVEYYNAQRSGYDYPGLGAGGVFFLIFLVAIGLSASTAARFNWSNVNIDDNDDLGGLFGNHYEFNDTLEQPLAAGDTLRLNTNHGDITITPWDQDKIKVVVTKKVVAENQDEANRLNENNKPTLTSQDHVVTLTSQSGGQTRVVFFGSSGIRTNLDISMPRKGAIEVSSDHGDLKITGREGDVQITHNHGDIALDDLTGSVNTTSNHGDFSAHKVTGDVRLNGRVSDVEIADVGGTVILNGDFFSDVSLARVGKSVQFESSRTSLQMGKLAGELRLDGSDLRVSNATGGFSVRSRSKDIHLEDLGGDISIQDRNGEIEIRPGKQPMGDVSIANQNGSIQLYMLPTQAFNLTASTRNGDIQSDFDQVNVSKEGSSATASASVGANGRRVQLSTEHADIEIRKGLAVAEEAPEPEPAPAPPAPPGAKPSHPTPRTPAASKPSKPAEITEE